MKGRRRMITGPKRTENAMNEIVLQRNIELQRILWSCYDYWSREPVPQESRSICHSWVTGPYQDRFGDSFHQSRLRELARLGFLIPDDTSRGGKRRYYRLNQPERIADLLARLGLLSPLTTH